MQTVFFIYFSNKMSLESQQVLVDDGSQLPVAVAHRIDEVVKLVDHPKADRVRQEKVALNNWVKLNRGWCLVGSKYSLANKLPIISSSEHYAQAAIAAKAPFIEEIRFLFTEFALVYIMMIFCYFSGDFA